MKSLETKIFFLVITLMIPFNIIFNDFLSGEYLNQIILFSLPLLWPGLAHGSLDLIIARKKKIINNESDNIIFLSIYIMIPISFFLLWINFPNLIFLTFLILSILHFGISDSITSHKIFSFFEIFIRGIIVISLPFLFHIEETIKIFTFFKVDEIFLRELVVFNNFIFFFLIIFMIFWLVANFRKIFIDKKIFQTFFEFLALFFCFWHFEPLISFFIYFCFLHSTRHLLCEKNNLKLNGIELIYKTLPITIATIIFLVISLFYIRYSEDIDFGYILIGLSSLTVSHILLINFTKKES
ncbi:MAG: Brp/Blh family beta-carotene 15,15'-dioxygenase [Pseudomonadota bacterium]|nr:Brp/Blh family beta-carotene 15,15'-dioxygenase [Pseudomonadota bacterium]